MQTQPRSPSARQSPTTAATRFRACIAAGWILVGTFVLGALWVRHIETNARVFQVLYLVGFAGYFLLVWTVRSGADGSGLGRWRWWLLGCALLRALLLPTQPSDDAHRYVWEGQIQWAGFNPYSYAPDDPALADLRDDNWRQINHPDHPAIYPPVAQFEFLVTAGIYRSIYTVKLLHVLWDIAVVATLGACLRRIGKPEHLAIVYGLCPLVLTAVAIEGHLDSLMLLFTVLAIRVSLDKRVIFSGVLIGLAIGSKLVAIVLLPWLVARRPKAAVAVALTVLAVYLPYSGAGWNLWTSLTRFAAETELLSLPGTFGLTTHTAIIWRLGVCVAACGVWLWLAIRRRAFSDYAVGAVAALLMLMPIVHYWYLTWILVFAAMHFRLRWLTAACAMVAYFNAAHALHLTGAWTMPPWVSVMIWSTFGLTWLVEERRKRTRNRENPNGEART